MLISHRWLLELLPGLDLPAAAVAERLTQIGLAVDGIRPFGVVGDTIVVAEVCKAEPHPTRSGLRLVTVDTGGSEQVVVCGASNVPAPGGLVVLARLGTTLPAVGVTLEPRKIGGILSEGMLCSERELGLAESSEGILVLEPGTARPGETLERACPHAHDTIFDVDVTPNRPDALGHLGVARDLAASLGIDFLRPEAGAPRRTSDVDLASLIAVRNEAPARCPRYSAAAVLGVELGPSPLWLQWRLTSLGIRPVSNVVDITNLLLLEAGQPMHAFDRAEIAEGRIVVRCAREGETLVTLDGGNRKLDSDDLLIADERGGIALAGIMGGADSEIRASTRDVILECAYFEPRGIRRSARRHGIHTESSHRFERGTDWGAIEWVLERAKSLLTELAGGSAVPGCVHDRSGELELPVLDLRSERLNALLGIEVPFEKAIGALARLGFEVKEARVDRVRVSGASSRPDVTREVDLIEEVARIVGLDAIPTTLPAIPPQTPRSGYRFEREVCRVAAGLGLSEALTHAFVSPQELDGVKAAKPFVTLVNPLSEERSVMRTSLLPGLLEALKRARRRGQTSVRLFSVGPVFLPPPEGEEPSPAGVRPRLAEDAGILPEERPKIAVVLAGPRTSHLRKPESCDLYDAKGVAVELVERLTRRSTEVEHVGGLPGYEYLHPRGAARVLLEGREVGCFGPLHPDVEDALDLGGAAYVVDIDLAAIERIGRLVPSYRRLPKLPPVVRDVAFELPTHVLAGDVQAMIQSAAGELCESVELFDLFEGGALPEGYRSLAFRVTYRDPLAAARPEEARTLTDKEVDACQQRVIAAAQKTLGANLRG